MFFPGWRTSSPLLLSRSILWTLMKGQSSFTAPFLIKRSIILKQHAFVSTCIVCAWGKSSHHPPVSLLQLLPVPSLTTFSVYLLLTSFPPSQSSHFVALPKLATARETADHLVPQVFHPHGIPLDIVSDQGPHFYLQGMKGILSCTWCTVSLIHSGQMESYLGCDVARIQYDCTNL